MNFIYVLREGRKRYQAREWSRYFTPIHACNEVDKDIDLHLVTECFAKALFGWQLHPFEAMYNWHMTSDKEAGVRAFDKAITQFYRDGGQR